MIITAGSRSRSWPSASSDCENEAQVWLDKASEGLRESLRAASAVSPQIHQGTSMLARPAAKLLTRFAPKTSFLKSSGSISGSVTFGDLVDVQVVSAVTSDRKRSVMVKQVDEETSCVATCV